MNCGPRLATRSFRMASLAISLLAVSTAATVARAQQSPNDSRDDFSFSDDATFAVPVFAPAPGVAVTSAALDELAAGPREVSAPSGKVSSATPAHKRQPVVTDWSTKHMVFGPPKTEEQKARLRTTPATRCRWPAATPRRSGSWRMLRLQFRPARSLLAPRPRPEHPALQGESPGARLERRTDWPGFPQPSRQRTVPRQVQFRH